MSPFWLSCLREAKTVVMANSSVISAAKVRNFVFGWVFERLEAAVSRIGFLRPRRAMVVAPAMAKLFEISRPMPVAPPLMRMVLPAADRMGRVGSMAG